MKKLLLWFLLSFASLPLFAGKVIVDEIICSDEGASFELWENKGLVVQDWYPLFGITENHVEAPTVSFGGSLGSCAYQNKFFLGKCYQGKYTPWYHLLLKSSSGKPYLLKISSEEETNQMVFEVLSDEGSEEFYRHSMGDNLGDTHISLKLEDESLYLIPRLKRSSCSIQ